ncbi:MAG: glutathione S-transferase N-terminal domain-containing protein [Pseudomonadota bacterium]
MITLHHLENSRSLRILWLLEELGLEYQLITSARDPETMLGPEAQAKIHPLAHWPVIEDDGETLAESGAITEYLIEKAGAEAWRPRAGQAGYTDYLYWLHFAEATLQPMGFMSLVFSRLPGSAPALVRPVLKKTAAAVQERLIQPRATRYLSYANTHLSENRFFAGDHPTGADVMMIFPLETSLARFGTEESYPHVGRYVREIEARPAYRRALEKGGRYDYVL